MDRTLACEAGNLGSTPNEDTSIKTKKWSLLFLTVAVYVDILTKDMLRLVLVNCHNQGEGHERNEAVRSQDS